MNMKNQINEEMKTAYVTLKTGEKVYAQIPSETADKLNNLKKIILEQRAKKIKPEGNGK